MSDLSETGRRAMEQSIRDLRVQNERIQKGQATIQRAREKAEASRDELAAVVRAFMAATTGEDRRQASISGRIALARLGQVP
jgi:hypothetical protein